MIEKPKKVLELFEGHPERLVMDPHNSTETSDGQETWDESPLVARWCLLAGIQFVYGLRWNEPYEKFLASLDDRHDGCTGFLLRHWDSESREYDFPAVIAKIREAGI